MYFSCCEHGSLVLEVPADTRIPPHARLSLNFCSHLPNSSVWTLLLGHFVFKSPVCRRSIFACICCVGGIVLVVGFDSGELKGNLLAIISAVLYSAYSLVLRAKSPDNVDISMSMMFGFVGLFSFIGFGALLPILHFTSVEVWHLCV